VEFAAPRSALPPRLQRERAAKPLSERHSFVLEVQFLGREASGDGKASSPAVQARKPADRSQLGKHVRPKMPIVVIESSPLTHYA